MTRRKRLSSLQMSERINKAKYNLIAKDPFFSMYLSFLEFKESKDIETFATDGRRIYYNREFGSRLTLAEIEGVLAHEVLHVAFQHPQRMQDRQPLLWNIACDMVINSLLQKHGYTLPEAGTFDPQKRDASAEEIYEQERKKLIERWKRQKKFGSFDDFIKDWGKNTINIGEILRPEDGIDPKELGVPPLNERDGDPLGKSFGMDSLGARRDVEEEEISPPPPPSWQTILRNALQLVRGKDTYTYHKLHKAYLPHRIIIPTASGYRVPSVFVSIDTSGSIGQRDLKTFLNELENLLKKIVDKVCVLWHDADVYPEEKPVTTLSQAKRLRPRGRGGTNFCPVFEYVNKQKTSKKILILFTDGIGKMPEKAPPYPVIWVSTERKDFPFGKVVPFHIGR